MADVKVKLEVKQEVKQEIDADAFETSDAIINNPETITGKNYIDNISYSNSIIYVNKWTVLKKLPHVILSIFPIYFICYQINED